ncbi:MAG: patatin-like phospholipase family protein [Anaerolineae bacterium]
MSQKFATSRTDKTALVLAGGGLTGAVYEMGALRAIDDLLVELDATQFDIYVGTSAGALVCSFLANGISPGEMIRGVEGQHPYFRGPKPAELFNLNVEEMLLGVGRLPLVTLRALRYYLQHVRDTSPTDVLLSMSEVLPSGIYDNSTLAHYMHETLIAAGGTDDFRELERELYIVATDIDTGARVVFSRDNPAAPISRAVAASSAVPILYKPVRIGDRDYMDGGVRGPASLDVAIERGATLVVVVNPSVPLDNEKRSGGPFSLADRYRISRKGVSAIGAQVYRTLFHAGLQYHLKQVQRQHPEVTFILIEPSPTDTTMFFFNAMRYSSRMTIAQHGYESVTLNLAKDYHRYKQALSRYGITISPRLVNEELEFISQAGGHPDAIRSVMERIASQPRAVPALTHRLQQTLDNLEAVLAQHANGSRPATNGAGQEAAAHQGA